MFKCPKCEFTHANLNSLRIHWQKSHKAQSIELRITLFEAGKRPTCECGCGQETEFKTLQLGFTRYVNGHNARVHNSWGHNPIAQAKSHTIQKKMRLRGEFKPNPYKGLTKETDERLVLRGERISQVFTPEKSAKYSDLMRRNRLDGTVPTLRGKDHGRWKGGTSALQPLCRSYLFRAWSYPKMKEANFTCQRCHASSGNGISLNVHHDKERFCDILQQAIQLFGEPGDDFDKKVVIAEWVTDYHIKHDISGVVLCEGCHDGAHGVC